MHHGVGAGQAGQGLRHHQRLPSRLSRPVLAGAAGTGRDGAEPTPWVPRRPTRAVPPLRNWARRGRGETARNQRRGSRQRQPAPSRPYGNGRGGDRARRRGTNAVGSAKANPRRPAPTELGAAGTGRVPTPWVPRRPNRAVPPVRNWARRGRGRDGAEPTPWVPRRPTRAVPPVRNWARRGRGRDGAEPTPWVPRRPSRAVPPVPDGGWNLPRSSEGDTPSRSPETETQNSADRKQKIRESYSWAHRNPTSPLVS
jgi:hypothetical protein